ncbi:MAG: geranylgeranyl reductase family protein [Calditrichaeota bacterium]|nr:geranylgeranyl reductase family protein [Calditrichota bacterium]
MYDLVIIGAGPSGSSAGRLAGQIGMKTLLIEKQEFPRYKPCGGALSEHAMSYLDFELPTEIIERDITGARIHYKNNFIEQYKDYRISTLVTRSKFDNYLLEKASDTGIKINLLEKVIDLIENQNYVEISTDRKMSYKARFVIIAEGAAGILKYKVRSKDRLNQFGVCAITEIPESNEIINKHIRNGIDIYFDVAQRGYGWIFPHDGYYSVGVGGLAKYTTNPRNILQEFLQLRNFNPVNNIIVHPIPAGGIKRKLVSSNSLLFLTGDSAGFVDSFYGEGIAYAIRSGQIAVETINRRLTSERQKLRISDYEETINFEFGHNLRYSLYLSKLMHKFPNVLFKIFIENKEILDKYLEVPAKRLSYKEFISWFLKKLPKYLIKTY